MSINVSFSFHSRWKQESRVLRETNVMHRAFMAIGAALVIAFACLALSLLTETQSNAESA